MVFLALVLLARYFDPVVLKARELGISVEKRKLNVVAVWGEKVKPVPFQIDDVRDGRFSKHDRTFSGEDEVVFLLRDCGKENDGKILKLDAEHVFKVEYAGKYCYILVGSNLKVSNFSYFRVRKKGRFIFVRRTDFPKTVLFEEGKPVVKAIWVKGKRIFYGTMSRIGVKVFGISITKTHEHISGKEIFFKAGKVRVVRVIRPALEIGFGIKIPSSSVVALVYPDFTKVLNAVPIPIGFRLISQHARASFFLRFRGAKEFEGVSTSVVISKNITPPREEGHYKGKVVGQVDGVKYTAMYFIKEITPIPVRKMLYFVFRNPFLDVGVELDLLTLPSGLHRFALWGFVMPPGSPSDAVELVENPAKAKVKKLR